MTDRHRVVITGLGVVTPIGLNAEDTWDSMINGRHGFGPITQILAPPILSLLPSAFKQPFQWIITGEFPLADSMLEQGFNSLPSSFKNAATIIDGRKFRPFSYHRDELARCHFCGETRAGVFHYKEVAR